MRTTRRGRDSRGAAAVEFALVVIPLLILVFGIIAYGFLLSFRQAIGQAAAEGARAATVTPADSDDAAYQEAARDEVNRSLVNYDVTCTEDGDLQHGDDPAGDCAITGPAACDGPDSEATCVTVTLIYEYADEPMVPDVGFGIVMPDKLTYTSSVRVS